MKSATVLYVEDNDVDRLLIEHACRRAAPALNLQMVADGESAVSYLSGHGVYADRAQHPLPTMVLLDVKLPGVSGIDVLRWLRAQPALAALPVAMLTSSFDPADIDAALAAGADFYLTKPSELKRLQHLLRVILEAHAHTPPGFEALAGLPECTRTRPQR